MFAVWMVMMLQGPAEAVVKPKVTIRVLRASPVNKVEWARSKQKTERIIVDEHGRKILVRLIEHQ